MFAEDRKDEHAAPEPETREHFVEGAEKAPPGTRAMAIVRWVLLLAVAAAAVSSVATSIGPLWHGAAHEAHAAQKYHCPMHPQIVSDEPGECPICHMSLEPMASERAAGSSDAPPAEGVPEGTTEVTLALDRVQAIGVRTALVESASSAEGLRVTASVEAPEGGIAEVHARASGFLEGISVKDTGAKVKAGQLLASIYSPEVFQAEQELLATSGWSAAAPGLSSRTTDAARQRLELLGVGRAAIDRMIETKKAPRTIGLTAPISGYVVEKSVVLGSYVTPDTRLYRIADLDHVYIIAHAYPHQLAAIHRGDTGHYTSAELPGRAISAKVDLVYPDVDLVTRTARVRFVVDNRDLALVPGQFGTIELPGAEASGVTIPVDAVVDTGRATYVFVVQGDRYVPRSVELGERIEAEMRAEGTGADAGPPDFTERFLVRRGLAEGERVVSGATFLVDAESRLRASLAKVSAHER
jgi:Cu(I)/Ag(I) efflux system membrane fusion protein